MDTTGIDLTPRSRHVLQAAAHIARRHREAAGAPTGAVPVVGVEHLFLAILQEEDGVPVQAIRAEADIHRMIDDVLRVMVGASYLDGIGAEPAPPWPGRPR
ncbi:Clp protease N-terminal domain-containing protein [Streptomonospora litoralis]|uniref:Uncharacterized protein n=1 Tax=Streptomonospora litoralis TaxID=2498135 RepID=A0A4P6PY85_9ACTN|nr:Clp protease N-terminal domain-containing protein [Streptomonospora litoralis]QBI53246.1 hypothetical protein EKD16_07250 [Streptomonospora litoralis]